MNGLKHNCIVCGNEFTQKKNLYAHLRKIHQIESVLSRPELKFKCNLCDKKFSCQSSLSRHTRRTHTNNNEHDYSSIDPVGKFLRKARLICPHDTCSDEFFSYVELRRHLLEHHSIEVECEDLTFNTISEFEQWKRQIQERTLSLYTKDTAMKFLKSGVKKMFFNCHRSYCYKSKGKNLRAIKSIGSNKIGKACPSRLEMTLTDDNGETNISVKFWKTHCGHSKEIQRMVLNKRSIRLKIAGNDDAWEDSAVSINSDIPSVSDICITNVIGNNKLIHEDLRNTKMWDVKACLTCLSTRNKLERITDTYRNLYVTLTGIKISEIDGYPTYFCVECQTQIRKVLAFRRKCRRAYYVMKEIVNVRKQVTFNDITKVNRTKTNLVSSINYCKVENTGFFSVDRVEPDVDTLIATLDKYDPEDVKHELIKRSLFVEGNVWHIDIRPSGVFEQVFEPEPDPEVAPDPEPEVYECNDEDPAIETLEDFPEDIVDDDEIGLESEEEPFELTPKARKKPKLKVDYQFKPKSRTGIMVSEMSAALLNADIKCLTKEEQRDAFIKAQMDSRYLRAIFKCAMCLTDYKNIDELMDHVKDHNKFVSYNHMCDICKTKFMDEQDLSVHKAENHEYVYTCKLCPDSTYNTLDKYLDHSEINHSEQVVHPETKSRDLAWNIKEHFDVYAVDNATMYGKLTHHECQHECTVCKMRFLNRKALKSHRKQHSCVGRPNKCDICGIYTEGTEEMGSHMEAWHLYIYKCNKCVEFLFNKVEAKQHAMLKHNLMLEYPCKHCDKQFRAPLSLRLHRVKNHYNELYCHYCVVCGNTFNSQLNLYKHQLTTHKYICINDPSTDEERFPCDMCNVKFLSLKSYQFHALKHRHEIANTFENVCVPCRKIFDTTEDVQDHMANSCKAVHRFPKKCPFCDMMMVNYKLYRRHHKIKHVGVPLARIRDPKLCEICGRDGFLDLTEHMKKHSVDEVVLECSHCTPPLRLPDVWKYCVHILTVHTPRPFTCGLCLEPYARRRDCKDHILKVHAPVNPYRCETCDQEFSHADYLNEHRKKFFHVNMEQRRKVKTAKRLYIYPHMKINVSMFEPKVLPSVRIYLCDYEKTKREIVSDINDYIVFDKQGELTPAVSKMRKKIQIKKETSDEVKLDSYGQTLEVVEEDGHHYNDYEVFDEQDEFPYMEIKKKRKRKKIENKLEGGDSVDLILDGQKLDVFEEDGRQYFDDNVSFQQEESPPVGSQKKRKEKKIENNFEFGLNTQKVVITEVNEQYVGSNIVFDNENESDPADSERWNRDKMGYKVESGVNVELSLDGQQLVVIEHDGEQYVNVNGMMYKIVQDDD